MNLVDDATGRNGRLGRPGNDLGGGRRVAAWIEQYGVPLALYTDWKNVYVREPKPRSRPAGPSR